MDLSSQRQKRRKEYSCCIIGSRCSQSPSQCFQSAISMIAGPEKLLGCVQKVKNSDNFFLCTMPPSPNSRIGRMSPAPQEAFGQAVVQERDIGSDRSPYGVPGRYTGKSKFCSQSILGLLAPLHVETNNS